MQENSSNFEIILPDGTVYNPNKKQKRDSHTIQGYTSDGKPKIMKFSAKTSCDRCGECCRRDTPVILKEDINLLIEGVISEKELYTIREGEKIRSSIDGDTYYSSMELIKVRPIFGSFTCIFYDLKEGCTIYEKRPSVCRQYECWSQNFSITGLDKKRLTRADLFKGVELIEEVLKKHEEKCSVVRFADLIDELRKGKEENTEKIAEMILYDLSIRDWIKEKLTVSDDVLPLLFGRTLFEIAPFYGLIIEKDGENFIIKITKEEEE
ncbi:MAG: YkgJ family cysteine cluster protein [Thermodesulfovibrio sp.]|nr:YkgJ family cysteine cluster protein [Thermodesulfovibrio sp.]MCX7724052.1 YkgJ family cysteine cluster protein [Thermodesulfovibrio sp.]MDW7972646.1 YkgJ family cysteine cluster protein [Thermodesulfovibrio sp.]